MHSCPVLFAVSCLLLSGGKNESNSLLRDLGDVKDQTPQICQETWTNPVMVSFEFLNILYL